MPKILQGFIRTFLPSSYRQTIKSSLTKWQLKYKYWSGYDVPVPVGSVKFGSFRRLNPISKKFGVDRGRDGKDGVPLDRYYIEGFLAKYSSDIHGHVLEFGDNHSTIEHGANRVIQSDVLNFVKGDPWTTIVGDITKADHIPSNTFDYLIDWE